MTEPDDLPDDEFEAMWDLAADNVAAWIECPCTRHAVFLGIAAGSILGYTPELVLSTAAQILAADDELPAGDVLKLHDLINELWPPQ